MEENTQNQKNSQLQNKKLDFNEIEILVACLIDYKNILEKELDESPEDQEIIRVCQNYAGAFKEFEETIKNNSWKSCGPDNIQNIISIFEVISKENRNVLLSSIGNYSDIVASSIEEQSDNSVESVESEKTGPYVDTLKFYSQTVNLYNDIAAIFSEVDGLDYKKALLDVIADGTGLYPDYKAFLDSFQEQLAASKGNSSQLEYGVDFYEKLNKLEQAFFLETLIPEYIISIEKKLEEAEGTEEYSAMTEKIHFDICIKRLYHKILVKNS